MYLQIRDTNIRLLGSLHLLPANVADLPNWVVGAYGWSERLVFESDPPTILPFATSATENDLRSLLPEHVWAKLEAVWPSEGPLPRLDEVQPWAAALFAPALFQKTVDGVERRFLSSAIAQSKPYSFLETADEIAATFGLADRADIKTALEFVLSNPAVPERQLQQMYAAWSRGDVGALYAVVSASPMFRLASLKSAVLDSRNLAWVPRIRELLNSRSRTLVVVGALHLGGPDNLVERLGLSVDQLAVG